MTRSCGIRWAQRLVLLVGALCLAWPGVAHSSSPSPTPGPTPGAADDQSIATLEAAGGHVTVIRLGQPQPPSPSMPLQLNDIVVTKQGRATVRFASDGSVIRIGPDSRVQINESAKQRDIEVFFGRLRANAAVVWLLVSHLTLSDARS